MRVIMIQAACVAVGSIFGGLLRWGVGVSFANWFGTAFPWGTFFINLSGSMFLGWFTTIITERLMGGAATWIGADNLRLMIAVGFTGAYTTFSTFEYESNELVRNGESLKAMAYILGSVALGLLAVRLGMMLARKM